LVNGYSLFRKILFASLARVSAVSYVLSVGAVWRRRTSKIGKGRRNGSWAIDNVAYDAPVIRTPYSEMSKAYRYIVMNSQVYSL